MVTNLPQPIVDYANRVARLFGADAVTAVFVSGSGEVRVELREGTDTYMADPDEIMTWGTFVRWSA